MWSVNGAGLIHTNQHGFGILSATRLAKAGLAWPGLPWMTIFSTPRMLPKHPDFSPNTTLVLKYNVTKEEVNKFYLHTLEQVVLYISLSAVYRGAVFIVIRSPMGAISMVMPPRLPDRTDSDLDFSFNSLHFLGESPVGEWMVNVSMLKQANSEDNKRLQGTVLEWRLTFHGSSLPNSEVANRIALVERAMTRELSELKKEAVNVTCSQKLLDFGHNEDILPDYILKSLLLAQFFFGSLGLWIVIEDLIVPYLHVTEETTPLLPHLDSNATAPLGVPAQGDPRLTDSMSGKMTDLWNKIKALFNQPSQPNEQQDQIDSAFQTSSVD